MYLTVHNFLNAVFVVDSVLTFVIIFMPDIHDLVDYGTGGSTLE